MLALPANSIILLGWIFANNAQSGIPVSRDQLSLRCAQLVHTQIGWELMGAEIARVGSTALKALLCLIHVPPELIITWLHPQPKKTAFFALLVITV